MRKPGLTLNSHGKQCLGQFLYSISAGNLLTSQLDYLVKKGLVDSILEYRDWRNREDCAGHCLTDLGMETAKRYFPKFRKKW